MGRLLSNYSTASSHDTGLDRLGLATPHAEDTFDERKTTKCADELTQHSATEVQKSPSLPRSMKLQHPALQWTRQVVVTQSNPNLLDSADVDHGGDDFSKVERWDSCEITELRLSGDKSDSENDSDIYDNIVNATDIMPAPKDKAPGAELKTLDGTEHTLGPTADTKPDLAHETVESTTKGKAVDEGREFDGDATHPPPLGPKPKLSTETSPSELQPLVANGENARQGRTDPPPLDSEPKPDSAPTKGVPTGTGGEADVSPPEVGPKPTNSTKPQLPPKPKPRKNLHGTLSSPLPPPRSPPVPARSQTMKETNGSTPRADSHLPLVHTRPVPTIRKGLAERKQESPVLSKKPSPPPVSPKPVRRQTST